MYYCGQAGTKSENPAQPPIDLIMSNMPFSMPGNDLDLQDPDVVADLLVEVAQLNREDARLRGSTVNLPDTGKLLITGDLHDNTPSLHRVVKRARLERSSDHHLVLHELIHGPSRINGMDLSIRTLATACAVKAAYPQQVHFLLSNHELAQRRQEHVSKEGGSDVQAFNLGLEHLYGPVGAEQVHTAFDAYVDSLPLAIRCHNGVMVAHSLPGPRQMKLFDEGVIDRMLMDCDLDTTGSAHMMVWGRRQNSAVVEKLAKAWDVDAFVLGHQAPEMGWDALAENILVITSEHGHGVCVPIDLATKYRRDDLIELVLPINAISL